jgi:hypothetical protein
MNALCTPLLPRLPLRSNMFALPARPSAQKDVKGEKSRQENLILFVSQEEKFLSWAPTRIGVGWRAELLKEIVNFRSRRWNGKRLSSGLINNTSQQKIYSTSFISIQCNYGEWQRRLKSTRAMDGVFEPRLPFSFVCVSHAEGISRELSFSSRCLTQLVVA